jgi:EAL domain-containing protein (putative c-di-GMP-specific phosphodiesterase class I)
VNKTKRYQQFKQRYFQAGECIFREGEIGDFAYIVEEGEVEISTLIDEKKTVLNILKSGSMFGELALVDGRPRSASAFASTDALLTIVTQEQVTERIESADPILRMLLLVVMRYFRSETSRFRLADKEKDANLSFSSIDLKGKIAEAVDIIRLESELRTAIDEEQFKLLFQPIMLLENMQVAGFEVLIRWQSPTRGLVSPDLFISLAESTSLIIPIGEWLIEKATESLAEIQAKTNHKVFISINVASRQIGDSRFLEFLFEKVKKENLDFSQIKLEILERCLFDNDQASEWVTRCREFGFTIALDDFGTGYSSLGYISRYHPDTVKIDKSLIDHIHDNRDSRSICRAIIEMSKALEMTVVAEGIEKDSQVGLLQEMGCTFGQGYFFAKPLYLQEAIALF